MAVLKGILGVKTIAHVIVNMSETSSVGPAPKTSSTQQGSPVL